MQQYQNCTMLMDMSAWQSFQLSLSKGSLNIFPYLEEKSISVAITETSMPEFVFQKYNQNLFSGYTPQYTSQTTIAVDDSRTTWNSSHYVLSATNATLTTSSLDPYGFPVQVIISGEAEKPMNPSWEASGFWQQLSIVDRSVVFCARTLTSNHTSFFVLANDKSLFHQLNLEGIPVTRSARLLVQMRRDGYISGQKGDAVYRQWGRYDPGSVKRGTTFSGITNGIKSLD